MKKTAALIFLIIAANIFCPLAESKSVVDKVGRTKDTESWFDKYTETAMNFIQRLFAAVKSPKGFIAPNVCVWKICSKPLKKPKDSKSALADSNKFKVIKYPDYEAVKKYIQLEKMKF